MKSTRWVITYVVMASVGLWVAFFMSLQFLTPSRAQTAGANQAQKMAQPASGDLPPEFLQDTQETAPANGNDGRIPPPPTQPPVTPAQPTPPVPPAPGGDPSQLQGNATGAVAPQFASDDQYTYDPTGHRDPFVPYRTYRPAKAGQQAKVVDLSDPLQAWDLDRFTVVAVMWGVRSPKAMVKDPDGKMYMIGKNTKIGRNNGQVVAIREGEVVVVETIENDGVQTKEVRILELKK